MKAKRHCARGIGLLLLAVSACAQSASSAGSLSITLDSLPTAALWQQYTFRLPAAGGAGLYHWHLNSGALPAGLKLGEDGELAGTPQESGEFEFGILLTDSDNPAKQLQKKFKLSLEAPLAVEWVHKANVNGQRIEGSIKVSNHTGRDFDLTMVVLAVNQTGRATAIGYQHFPLKMNTRDMEIPFGDTPSWGVYQVNVDVVAEEPVSNRILRARLVVPKLAIIQGP